MAKEAGENVNAKEDAVEEKYAFSDIYNYVADNTYPVHADKAYKRSLRKRSKYFSADGGRLYYVGG